MKLHEAVEGMGVKMHSACVAHSDALPLGLFRLPAENTILLLLLMPRQVQMRCLDRCCWTTVSRLWRRLVDVDICQFADEVHTEVSLTVGARTSNGTRVVLPVQLKHFVRVYSCNTDEVEEYPSSTSWSFSGACMPPQAGQNSRRHPSFGYSHEYTLAV